jgi:AcrR family transcriptional regulator
MVVKPAKKTRSYDARRRVEQSQRNRENVIQVAWRAFLANGYAGTTLSAIAEEAGVSVETIHKAFGGKSGLVRAIYERGLAGREPTPAPDRSDAMSASEADPRALVRQWGTLTAEVAPLVAPILLLVRAAATTDPELLALLDEADRKRLARMTRNASVLAKRGFLRADITAQSARDVMWTCTSPELYELLVQRRGWSATQFGEFVGRTLEALLLRDTDRPR